MEDIVVTHESYYDLLKDFMEWHNSYSQWNSWDAQDGFRTLWHMGHIIETDLFCDAYHLGIIGEFDSPYCPIEVASILEAKGFAPDSVDKYAETHGIKIDAVEGGTHNPLYDCIIAAKVYFDLMK
jgi:hypothetical protein